jgi:hypothetical protein
MPKYVSGIKTAVLILVAIINCLSTETIEIRLGKRGICSFRNQLTCHHITIVHIEFKVTYLPLDIKEKAGRAFESKHFTI